MSFLTPILTWLVEKILSYLLSKVIKAVEEHEALVKLDQERNQIDENNIKKYEEAKDRADRIRAATSLLNGDIDP